MPVEARNRTVKGSFSRSSSSVTDIGLLVLRLTTGISLFVRHGIEKIAHFSAMSAHFPDPIHIGRVPTFMIALISDSICSLLIALGIATRWAALFAFCNIAVAWALVHHFRFGPRAGQGELMVIYLGALASIALTGGGGCALGHLLGRGR
jgi:putative oxidoreductase